MFAQVVLKRGVQESVWFYIGNLTMYTFLALTLLSIKSIDAIVLFYLTREIYQKDLF